MRRKHFIKIRNVFIALGLLILAGAMLGGCVGEKDNYANAGELIFETKVSPNEDYVDNKNEILGGNMMWIGFVIWSMVAIIFLEIGIHSRKGKEAAGFFIFTPPPRVNDVKQYNHAVSNLWLAASGILELTELFERGMLLVRRERRWRPE